MSFRFTHFLAATCFLLTSQVNAEQRVNIYNWSEYLPQHLIEKFTKETGIKVNYSTFESNETMYAKLKLLNGKGYDLVVPSTYYVTILAKDNLLEPLDKAKLPLFNELDPSILNQPFDPNNHYSLPYMWGSTALGFNSEIIASDKVKSWQDLWRPEFAGQLLLTDDVRDVFGMALILNGHDINTQNETEIEQAYKKLIALKQNVTLFNSDSPHVPLIMGEVNVGMQWNGTAYRAHLENPSIEFVYPEEGAIFWMDNMVIPKNAENKNNAYAFINFLLKPENQAILVQEIGYAIPNLNALAHLPPALRNSEVIFPPKAVKDKGQFLAEVGDAMSIYHKYWQELKK